MTGKITEKLGRVGAAPRERRTPTGPFPCFLSRNNCPRLQTRSRLFSREKDNL